MFEALLIRPIERVDYPGWRPLWDGYNRFYGRHGASPNYLAWERLYSENSSERTAGFFDQRFQQSMPRSFTRFGSIETAACESRRRSISVGDLGFGRIGPLSASAKAVRGLLASFSPRAGRIRRPEPDVPRP